VTEARRCADLFDAFEASMSLSPVARMKIG
jgi:hypothetical protein